MKKEIAKGLEKAVQLYSDHAILRATVNAIPYVGGSLDVLIASRGQKIVQKRIALLLERLQTDMNTVEEKMIDRVFLESEEWFDLVVKTMESAVRTRDAEKIKLYSRILRNAVVQSDRETHYPEDYLAILVELTPREIQLARAIYAQQNDRPREEENELKWAMRKGWENLAVESGLDAEELPFLLKRLERSGLIREFSGTYWNYKGGVYIITEVFRKLTSYLSEGT